MVNTHDILLSFSRRVKDILDDKLTKIILYGSYARGDYRENSDIDIMALTTLTDEEIRKIKTDIYELAFDFQMEYGIDISVIVKNEEHLNYWLGALPFYDFYIVSKEEAYKQMETANFCLQSGELPTGSSFSIAQSPALYNSTEHVQSLRHPEYQADLFSISPPPDAGRYR